MQSLVCFKTKKETFGSEQETLGYINLMAKISPTIQNRKLG
jgi:hypothetical protein